MYNGLRAFEEIEEIINEIICTSLDSSASVKERRGDLPVGGCIKRISNVFGNVLTHCLL